MNANVLIWLFFIGCIAFVLYFIRKKWIIPWRGYTQLSLLVVSEIAFLCNKGIPCSNCPLSFGICPLGTVQRLAFIKQFPFFLTLSLIAGTGLLLGTLTCSWACPIGFVQDLINAVGLKPQMKLRNSDSGRRLFLVVLLLLILIEKYFLIFSRARITALNELTIYGGTAILLSAFFVRRSFCRFLCPFGLIYGWMNQWSPVKVSLQKCRQCAKCEEGCIMDLKPATDVNKKFCVKCYDCSKVCRNAETSRQKRG